jgi:hypothetical protein
MWEHRAIIQVSGVESLRGAIKLLANPKPEEGAKRKRVSATDDGEESTNNNQADKNAESAYSPSKSKPKLVTTDQDEEDEKPAEKVVNKKNAQLPVTKKCPAPPPEEDEEEINNEDDIIAKDEIIEELEKELDKLKAELKAKTKPRHKGISSVPDFSQYNEREVIAGLFNFIRDGYGDWNNMWLDLSEKLDELNAQNYSEDEEEVAYDDE